MRWQICAYRPACIPPRHSMRSTYQQHSTTGLYPHISSSIVPHGLHNARRQAVRTLGVGLCISYNPLPT
ncbi:unnamed protein product [Staurois parvus]|uniref:Uncharacterized protein n=1 Tax=Staurois parvus TaxID=386267 RepID=A0ABN9AHE1_9NEOB|nr:unnamed protein product [Staurois parvus]